MDPFEEGIDEKWGTEVGCDVHRRSWLPLLWIRARQQLTLVRRSGDTGGVIPTNKGNLGMFAKDSPGNNAPP